MQCGKLWSQHSEASVQGTLCSHHLRCPKQIQPGFRKSKKFSFSMTTCSQETTNLPSGALLCQRLGNLILLIHKICQEYCYTHVNLIKGFNEAEN